MISPYDYVTVSSCLKVKSTTDRMYISLNADFFSVSGQLVRVGGHFAHYSPGAVLFGYSEQAHTHSTLCLSFKIGYIESIKIVKKLPVIGRLTHDRK